MENTPGQIAVDKTSHLHATRHTVENMPGQIAVDKTSSCTLQDILVLHISKLLNNINIEPLMDKGSPKYIHLLPQIEQSKHLLVDLNINRKDLLTGMAKIKMASLGHHLTPMAGCLRSKDTEHLEDFRRILTFPPFHGSLILLTEKIHLKLYKNCFHIENFP